MAESDRILSQHEVDALLSAIDSSEVEIVPEHPGAPIPIPYDFRRPQRLLQGEMRSLELCHEGYVRSFQAALSGLLRTGVEARVAGVEQTTFHEYIHALPSPTALAVVSCEPLRGSLIFELHPDLAFTILERLMGSRRAASSPTPERAPTPIEWGLLERVIGRALGLLREAWMPLAPASLKVVGLESNPQSVQALEANEPVLSLLTEITIGELKGYHTLCLPVSAVEGRIRAAPAPAGGATPVPDVAGRLATAKVWASAHLPAGRMKLRDVEALRAGRILTTGEPASGTVVLSIEGHPKFLGKLGAFRDRKALRIETSIDAAAGAPDSDLRLQVGAGRGAGGAHLRVPLTVTAVLSEKTMRLRDVASLARGQVVEFPRREGVRVELRAGERAVASGAAVRIVDHFGVQVTGGPAPAP